MRSIFFKSKQELIASWVQSLKKNKSKILVSDYCYNCSLTGYEKNKTLIVFPNELEQKGVISIDKPLEQVELQDIIELYSRINEN